MSEMERAYRLAARAVRRRYEEQHPKDLTALHRLRRKDIAVYSGSYDQAENLLACMRLESEVNPEPKRLRARIVFVNCSDTYHRGLVDAIARHVAEGAWLVTTDWALHYVLERAFPHHLRWTQRMTGDEVIAVEPYLESVWSEIVVLGADPQWWLWGSYPIEVVDPERVRIEAASHDLLQRYGAPVVAARFDWGKGHVFHVISHFWAKRSRTPTRRHQGPCTDFLKAGMGLSDEGIAQVLREAVIAPDAVSFAELQSAATATELVAQLCVRAVSTNRR
jgi:hypothetical protein